MIEDYETSNIGPCSVNFRLGELFKHQSIAEVDIEKGQLPELTELSLPHTIQPGEYLLGRTIEKMNTPPNVFGIYKIKSQAFRIGLNIISGINDPEYKGNIVFGIQNVSINPIKLTRGMTLLHGVFMDIKGEAVPLKTRFLGGRVL